MNTDIDSELHEGPIAVAEKDLADEPRLHQRYRVVLMNDDYTPMDFVVVVLERFFAMDRFRATKIMLDIHSSGSAVCGEFTLEIAETKVNDVNRFSKEHEHPLLCVMEGIDPDES